MESIGGQGVFPPSFAVADGRVYTIGNTDDVDTVFCFDAANGTIRWMHSYSCPLTPLSYEGGPSATPAVDGQGGFTLSKSGHLFCLDAKSGKVIWSSKSRPAEQKEGDYSVDWGYAALPLVVGEKLILSVGWAGLALSKADGKVLCGQWSRASWRSLPVPLQVRDRTCFAMLVARGVVAVEADNGASTLDHPQANNMGPECP